MPSNPNDYLDIAPDVATALAAGEPVVALESTIISHGMPFPKNVKTAMAVETTVRDGGATPATIAILDGRLKVGLSSDEIRYLGEQGTKVVKCSRRDLPFIIDRKQDGATTVAATMIIAALAGIRIFATGGIGGVHRGVEDTLDISADLEELARTNLAVVCAGIKSVLDIGRTLEYLETKGVPVVGYETDTLPAFYSRSSGFAVDYRVDTAAEVASALQTKWGIGLDGGMVVAVPIPEQHALDNDEIDGDLEAAITEMQRQGITRQRHYTVPAGQYCRAHGRPKPRGQHSACSQQRAGCRGDRQRIGAIRQSAIDQENITQETGPLNSNHGYFKPHVSGEDMNKKLATCVLLIPALALGNEEFVGELLSESTSESSYYSAKVQAAYAVKRDAEGYLAGAETDPSIAIDARAAAI